MRFWLSLQMLAKLAPARDGRPLDQLRSRRWSSLGLVVASDYPSIDFSKKVLLQPMLHLSVSDRANPIQQEGERVHLHDQGFDLNPAVGRSAARPCSSSSSHKFLWSPYTPGRATEGVHLPPVLRPRLWSRWPTVRELLSTLGTANSRGFLINLDLCLS